MIDWNAGRYERLAREFEPVAEHMVRRAGVGPGDRVLDIACGTGNAALLATRAGAVATGLDAAGRLISIARMRAEAEGLDASFVLGDIHALPFRTDEFDAALSVFGVVFAADPERAVSETMRILRPGGRALISVLTPNGLHNMIGVVGRTLSDEVSARAASFPWHDRDAVSRLAAEQGVDVEWDSGAVAMGAESPEAYLATWEQNHPLYIGARAVLGEGGRYRDLRAGALRALHEANEDPDQFRITSSYDIAVMTRRGR